MIRTLMGFLRDERGATAADYALIAALVSVAVVGGIDIMGQRAHDAMTSVSSGLEAVAR
jgi:pilus assembly protein Flp/PilA